jgi:hypothetical protein
MWLDLAVQKYSEREVAHMTAHLIAIRDRIGDDMSVDAIAEARRRAAAWTPRKE